MVDKLARRVRISLTSVTLSNLIRSLREACTADFSGIKDTLIPLHYLFGWFNLQFQNLYDTVISETRKSKLPYLIYIVGAFPIHFRDVDACMFFRMFEFFSHPRIIFPNKKRLLNEQTN